MKAIRLTGLVSLLFLFIGSITVSGQNYQAEVPGDNFSLEGALDLFKKSSSPEDFERLLNSPDSHVNNLDLNGDGEIDYIRVTDRNDGAVHDFILQDLVSDNQIQDVAVIELTKDADGKATLQITGDADIYGVETIIEPSEEVSVYAGTTTTRTVVNVWTWPAVRYVYSPAYVVYDSPWGWSYWPYWWHTWRPVDYYVYYGWSQPYHSYYSVCYTQRNPYAYYHVYRPYRHTSEIVYGRHHDEISHYREDHHDEHHYGYSYNDGYDHSGRDRGPGGSSYHWGDSHHDGGGDTHGGHSDGNNGNGGNPHGNSGNGGNPHGNSGNGGNPHGNSGNGGNPHGNSGNGGNPHGNSGNGGNPHGNQPGNSGDGQGAGSNPHRDRTITYGSQGSPSNANDFGRRYSNSSLSHESTASTQRSSSQRQAASEYSMPSRSGSFSTVHTSSGGNRVSTPRSSSSTVFRSQGSVGHSTTHSAPQRSSSGHSASSGRSRGR